MKVVFFTTGMTRGGAERVIATIANRLVDIGHEVVIVILKGHESEYYLDGRVRLVSAELEPGVKNALSALRFYKRTIRRECPDVVVALTLKANLMACLAKVVSGVKVPLIVSERANPFVRKFFSQVLCNILFKVADIVVCQSQVVGLYYEARLGFTPVSVIANPVDEKCVAEQPSQNRGCYVLSVGRLSCLQKRQDIAIRAFAQVALSRPDLRLKICGIGDGLSELMALTNALAIADVVDFEGNVENVMRIHADASAYLMSSDFEGFPNALIEATASGIPTVTTDFSPSGIAQELVKDSYNGFVVPTGDDSAMADALERILEGEIREECLLESAKTIKEKFSLNQISKEWLVTCERAIKGGQ